MMRKTFRNSAAVCVALFLGIFNATPAFAAEPSPWSPVPRSWNYPENSEEPESDEPGNSWSRPVRLVAGTGVTVFGSLLLVSGSVGAVGGTIFAPLDDGEAARQGKVYLLAGGVVTALGVAILMNPWAGEGGWGNLSNDRVSLRLLPSGKGAALALRF